MGRKKEKQTKTTSMTEVAAAVQPIYCQKGGVRQQKGLNSNGVGRPDCAIAFSSTNYIAGKSKLNKKNLKNFLQNTKEAENMGSER